MAKPRTQEEQFDFFVRDATQHFDFLASDLPQSELDALRWIFESGCGPKQIAKSPGETFANVVDRAKLEQLRGIDARSALGPYGQPRMQPMGIGEDEAKMQMAGAPAQRIAAALESIAESFAKKDRRWEKARAESWDTVRHQPVRVDPTNPEHAQQACIFCAAKSAWVMRGTLILGCVVCIGAALRSSEP